MRIRWIQTENSSTRYVEKGTVADTDDALAVDLINAGIAEAVPAESERAVKPKATKAVRK